MNLQNKMIEINWTVCTWIKMIKYEPVEKNTLKSRSDEQEMIRDQSPRLYWFKKAVHKLNKCFLLFFLRIRFTR